MLLNHEKLDVYQVSIEFAVIASGLVKQILSGYAFLSDQLKRASFSITLNIAEGSGRSTDKDKSRFYKVARGSANECAAIFDITFAIGIIDEPFYTKAKSLLFRIVSMLCKMF